MTITAERALNATGLLAQFNDAGVLTLADVHTATRIARLGDEPDETVALAIALTVRALRLGSVCIDLADVSRTTTADEDIDLCVLPWPNPVPWQAACTRSPVVAAGGEPGRPLRLARGLLYLDRYWRDEELVRRQLQQRAAAAPLPVDMAQLRTDLQRLFADGDQQQRLAAAVSALRRITVLAGGPGTGKTTTIAKLLAVLSAQHGGPPRIALAAPTGKAAARLEEAVRQVGRPLGLPDLHASTLHRLLGRRPGSHTRFRHNRTHHLPYDVIVIDETSMVSLTLMARLIEAVRPDARLILVGDPDQLASVEAGSVLGDIVTADGLPEPALRTALSDVGQTAHVTNGVVTLIKTWRFGGDIATLANAIRNGDEDSAVAVLRGGGDQIDFVDPSSAGSGLRTEIVATLQGVAAAADQGDASAALQRLDEHRLLCAHRHGPHGVSHWTSEIAGWLADPDLFEWVPGRPLLITANDYDAGLYNGDTGVVVNTPDGLRAAFARGGDIALIPPSRLSEAQPLYAMTVHRSQGSQFGRVTLVLPPATSPLLTRELLYTGVTRAKIGLRIIGAEEAVRAAISRPIARASGLRDSLAVAVSIDERLR